MTTQKIINGPSKWDIMLCFFENKRITFTLEDGTIIEVDEIDCMWNMSGYDSYADVNSFKPNDTDHIDGFVVEGYLLRGYQYASDKLSFIEYLLRSRNGHHAAVEDDERADTSFLPRVWSEVMGMKNIYTE
jgi:hypothetical protein